MSRTAIWFARSRRRVGKGWVTMDRGRDDRPEDDRGQDGRKDDRRPDARSDPGRRPDDRHDDRRRDDRADAARRDRPDDRYDDRRRDYDRRDRDYDRRDYDRRDRDYDRRDRGRDDRYDERRRDRSPEREPPKKKRGWDDMGADPANAALLLQQQQAFALMQTPQMPSMPGSKKQRELNVSMVKVPP